MKIITVAAALAAYVIALGFIVSPNSPWRWVAVAGLIVVAVALSEVEKRIQRPPA
jgi:uncharacterized membrane protein